MKRKDKFKLRDAVYKVLYTYRGKHVSALAVSLDLMKADCFIHRDTIVKWMKAFGCVYKGSGLYYVPNRDEQSEQDEAPEPVEAA